MSLVDHMALSIQDALPLVTHKLAEHGLRERIRVIASGKLITPNWVAWALCMGADFVNSARGFMFAIGCIQSMRCNNDTCPTGVTTHNPRLQRGLDPEIKAERVRSYVAGLRREVGIIAHACGVADARQLQPKHVRQVGADGRARPYEPILERAEP
jgi:glutamate synthase domain-containing protein 2